MLRIKNNKIKYINKNELMVYALIWGVIYATDLMGLYTRSLVSPMAIFDWRTVAIEIVSISVTLVFFLIHNFFVAPLLVYRNKYIVYGLSIVALMTMFIVWQVNNSPEPPKVVIEHTADGRALPPRPSEERQRLFRPGPPPGIGEPDFFTEKIDIVAASLFIVMIGLNVSVKYYFRFSSERKRLKDIEKHSLERQLEYLKYQINPHFFMNTLNNIHALVDIDAEKAKRSIVELSRLMRFVLYDGANPQVDLRKEIDFMRNYIQIMQMRYSEGVEISFDVDEHIPNRQIAPLIMISFAENAFKHGISYRKSSYVKINISFPTDNELVFVCSNSKIDTNADVHGGVGLKNAKQRLDLIYGNKYKLTLTDSADEYKAELNLPL